MLDHPYLASAITRFPLHECRDARRCPIMSTDGFHIFYNPAGLQEYSRADQCFILAHEVLHCLLGHIDRREDRDPRLWNIAIDFATNLLLVDFGMKMPVGGLIANDFRGNTAEEIYEKLRDWEDSENPPWKSGTSFDMHLQHDAVDGMLESLGEGDHESPSPLERKRIRKAMSKEFLQDLRKSQGELPLSLEQEITQAGGGRVPWQALLARFFTGLRRDDYRLFPASKKHIWRGLYLPSIGRPGPSHVIVAVDTSGSMSENELGKILAEIDKLRSFSQCRLTLIQCDAQVHKVEEFDEHTPTRFERHPYRFYGGGGTSFTPVFEWLAEQSASPGFRPDVLFYMTDGYGSFPDRPPALPVAWVLTHGSSVDVEIPFGQKIMMSP